MSRFRLPDTPEDRFEALYTEQYGPVLGYVLRRAPASVAPDVVADVFLVAWRRLDDVPDDPLPWLLGVARKALANERRGGSRRAALLGALEETTLGHEREIPADERLLELTHSVACLGEADRELLRLIAWDGLTTREAAVVLGITHVACRVRLHRVRRRLACDLGAENEIRPLVGGVGRFDAGKEVR